MAKTILVLTDNPENGRRLARSLGGGALLHDLYDDGPIAAENRVVVADIHFPHSDSINRLKRALGIARGPATPLLYLFHGNQERGEIQAAMLGATKCLSAMSAAALLAKTVETLAPSPPGTPKTPI